MSTPTPLKPRGRRDVLADLEQASDVIEEAPAAPMPVTPAAEVAPEQPQAQLPAKPEDLEFDWRVLPKRKTYRQVNIRLEAQTADKLKEMALFTEGESQNSIAQRAIEKELALMLFEKQQRALQKK